MAAISATAPAARVSAKADIATSSLAQTFTEDVAAADKRRQKHAQANIQGNSSNRNKMNAINREHAITRLGRACNYRNHDSPSPVHPSTELFEATIESIHGHAPVLSKCRKVVMCDGVLV